MKKVYVWFIPNCRLCTQIGGVTDNKNIAISKVQEYIKLFQYEYNYNKQHLIDSESYIKEYNLND